MIIDPNSLITDHNWINQSYSRIMVVVTPGWYQGGESSAGLYLHVFLLDGLVSDLVMQLHIYTLYSQAVTLILPGGR